MAAIILVIFIFSCIIDGISDGFFFHGKNASIKYPINVHIPFTIRRALWNAALILCLYLDGHHNQIIYPMVAFMFMFSFLHNGSYYFSRNKLDKRIYSIGWFDQSTTSTAHWTKYMTPEVRTVFFVIGLMIYFVWVN